MSKKDNPQLSVKIRDCGYRKCLCCICGDLVDDPGAIAYLEIDGVNQGDVCPACLEAGPSGAIERQKAYIEHTKGFLKYQTELKALLKKDSPDNWATLDDLRRMFLEGELSYWDVTREQMKGKTLDELEAMYAQHSAQLHTSEPIGVSDSEFPF
jgi:hypothetical protein